MRMYKIFVCVALGLSAPVMLCPAGYFCREGTLTLNPSDTTPLRPMPCAPGTFCLAGVAHNLTIDWIPTRPEAATAPQTCTEGTYCELGSASPAGSGPCFPGHYCPPGSVYPTEVPIGRFSARNGSVAPTLCFPGTYAPLKSTVQCRVCPAGYQCAAYGTYEPSICEAGTYRSLADSVTCRLCPQGTWSVLPGVTDISRTHRSNNSSRCQRHPSNCRLHSFPPHRHPTRCPRSNRHCPNRNSNRR